MQIVHFLFDKHRLLFSFSISLSLMVVMMFKSESITDIIEDKQPTTLEVVQIDTLEQAAHVYKKELSTDVDATVETKRVSKAKGTSNNKNAIDLAFHPNIAAPRPIGRLKKDYPKSGKDENIEATVFTEVVILENGRVNKVKIIGVKLSKSLPKDKKNRIKAGFAKSAKKILYKARFSSTIINGKKVPIRIEFPMKFSLRDV